MEYPSKIEQLGCYSYSRLFKLVSFIPIGREAESVPLYVVRRFSRPLPLVVQEHDNRPHHPRWPSRTYDSISGLLGRWCCIPYALLGTSNCRSRGVGDVASSSTTVPEAGCFLVVPLRPIVACAPAVPLEAKNTTSPPSVSPYRRTRHSVVISPDCCRRSELALNVPSCNWVGRTSCPSFEG